MSRSLLSRGVAFATLALCAAAACADEVPATPARAGLKVRIDPATGNVVDEAPATAEAQVETQAAEAERSRFREKADYNRMTTRTNAHGAVLLNLNGQVRMYSIATVKPSGDVEETCITGNELAQRQADGTLAADAGAKEH